MYPGGAIFPGTAGFIGNFPAGPMFVPGFKPWGECLRSRPASTLVLVSMRETVGMAREIAGTVTCGAMESEAEGVGVAMPLTFLEDPRGPQQAAAKSIDIWHAR
jgi:hypothetical protein